MSMKSERLLTYGDMADKLHLSRTAVWQLVRDGELREPIRIGRARRFREADVDRWIRRQSGEDAPSGDSGSADDGNPAAGAAGA